MKIITRFHRVTATIRREKSNEVLVGRVMLTDLSDQGVGIFLPEPIGREERVTIVIDYHRSIYLKGEIAWCGLYMMSTRILSPECFAYRAYIRFRFDSPEEREALKTFVL